MKKINNNTYLLVLSKGDLVMEKLRAFHKTVNYNFCKVEAIGALKNVELGYAHVTENGVNYEYKTFKKDHEVLSFSGSISLLNGDSLPHVHLAISDETFATYGGHLKEAEVAVTLEIIITVYDEQVTRSLNNEFKIGIIE